MLCVQDRNVVNFIVCSIRQRIAQGTWPRGSLLPTRAELAQVFAISPSTIQLAIRELTADGLVVTRKRAGTRIATSAPEYGRYALAMSDHGPRPVEGSGLFHDQLLLAAARVPQLHPGWRLEAWAADDPALHSLVRSGALKGIWYVGVPAQMPPVTGTGIPLACFHYPGAPWYGDINLTTSKLAFVETCVRALRRGGHSRIGFLETDALPVSSQTVPGLGARLQGLSQVVEANGGHCPAPWIQCADPRQPITAYQALLLLLRNPLDRPSAIVLLDDHLLPPVLEAIRDAGLQIPSQIAICVLGYEGRGTQADGCLRVGFDLEALTLEVLGQLERHRQGHVIERELVCRYTELSGE